MFLNDFRADPLHLNQHQPPLPGASVSLDLHVCMPQCSGRSDASEGRGNLLRAHSLCASFLHSVASLRFQPSIKLDPDQSCAADGVANAVFVNITWRGWPYVAVSAPICPRASCAMRCVLTERVGVFWSGVLVVMWSGVVGQVVALSDVNDQDELLIDYGGLSPSFSSRQPSQLPSAHLFGLQYSSRVPLLFSSAQPLPSYSNLTCSSIIGPLTLAIGPTAEYWQNLRNQDGLRSTLGQLADVSRTLTGASRGVHEAAPCVVVEEEATMSVSVRVQS